jgi:hypothetical protein
VSPVSGFLLIGLRHHGLHVVLILVSLLLAGACAAQTPEFARDATESGAVTYIEGLDLASTPSARSQIPLQAEAAYSLRVVVQQQDDPWVQCGNPRVVDSFGNQVAELSPIEPSSTGAEYGYAAVVGASGYHAVTFDAQECNTRGTGSEAIVIWRTLPLTGGRPSGASEALSVLPIEALGTGPGVLILDQTELPADVSEEGIGCRGTVTPLPALRMDDARWCAMADGVALVGLRPEGLDLLDLRHHLGDRGYMADAYGEAELWRLSGKARSVAILDGFVAFGEDESVKAIVRVVEGQHESASEDPAASFALGVLSTGFRYRFTSTGSFPGGSSWVSLGQGRIAQHQASRRAFDDAKAAADAAIELRERHWYDVEEAGPILLVQRRVLGHLDDRSQNALFLFLDP